MGRYKPQVSGRRVRTKRRTKGISARFVLLPRTYSPLDVDQIWDEMNRPKFQDVLKKPIDPTLPGLGQYYCEPCA